VPSELLSVARPSSMMSAVGGSEHDDVPVATGETDDRWTAVSASTYAEVVAVDAVDAADITAEDSETEPAVAADCCLAMTAYGTTVRSRRIWANYWHPAAGYDQYRQYTA